MQNNPEITRKTKKLLIKYWAICVIHILPFLVYVFFANYVGANLYFILGILPLAVFLKISRSVLYNKLILSVVENELDATAFLAFVKKVGDSKFSLNHIFGEYCCGNHQNVVGICKKKLDDPKLSGRTAQYQYLTYLANVYFELDDLENLRIICDRFHCALEAESPRKQKIYGRIFSRISFYDSYLKQDFDTCADFLNAAATSRIQRLHRKFCKAKLAQIQGNMEEARNHYESLKNEAPRLNFGKLAERCLLQMSEKPLDDSFRQFEISQDIPDAPVSPSNLRNRIIITIFATILLLLFSFFGFYLRNLKYECEANAYREELRVLIEETYNGVEILDVFNLRYGDEVIDATFLCKTNSKIIVGCVYMYGQQSELHYEMYAAVPFEDFETDDSLIWDGWFLAATTDYRVDCSFQKHSSDLPKNTRHTSLIEVNGQKVCFIVTKITPL